MSQGRPLTNPYLHFYADNSKVFIKVPKFSIGRGLTNSLVLEDIKISRNHCVFEEKGGKWYLIDVSTNGTTVDGKKIGPNTPYELTTGDVVQLSDSHEFIFINDIGFDDFNLPTQSQGRSVPSTVNHLQEGASLSDIQAYIDSSINMQRGGSTDQTGYDLFYSLINNLPQGHVDLNQNNATTHDYLSNMEIEPTTDHLQRVPDQIQSTNNENDDQDVQIIENTDSNKTKDETVAATEEVVAECSTSTAKSEKGNIKTKNPDVAPSSSGTLEDVENELQCSICTELFIRAITTNCSHSFCQFCLQEWRKKSNKCPICRTKITTSNPTIVLDNFIAKVLQSASEEVRQRREETVREREKLEYTTPKNTRPPSIRPLQRIRFDVPIEISSEEDSSDMDIDDFMDYADSSDYNGVGGAYYGGYGHCFSCGERGHWSNGCPYR